MEMAKLFLVLIGIVCTDAFCLSTNTKLGPLKSALDFSRFRQRWTSLNPRMVAPVSQRTVRDMRFNQLGDSDLLVSEVCLGTMTWGKQNTEEDAIKQMNMAFDRYGVNFIDTAEGYPIPLQPETQGATDRVIGKWLASRPRNRVILATKVGIGFCRAEARRIPAH